MKTNKEAVSATEITPIEGIKAIRNIVGQWLRPEGTKPRDAIAGVANVLLAVSVPVLHAPKAQPANAEQCAENYIDALARAAGADAPKPMFFVGLTAQKVDIVTHLEKMIEQACHKPGEWKEGPCAGGSIEGRTFTSHYDLQIGTLLQRRDAFLAIDAVNALPELIKRVRDAEREAADLRGALEASVNAHNQLIDAMHAERDAVSANA